MILGQGDHAQSCHRFVGNSGSDFCLRLSILFRMKFFICCTSCLDRIGGDTSLKTNSSPNALRPSWLLITEDSILLVGLLLLPHPLLLLQAFLHFTAALPPNSLWLHLLLEALQSFLYHCLLLPSRLGNSQLSSGVGTLTFLCQDSIGFQPLNPTSITLTGVASRHEVWKNKDDTVIRMGFKFAMLMAGQVPRPLKNGPPTEG